MKRFKLIFHAIYIMIFLVILYFSVDILMNTEQYLSKIKLSSYIKFPKYVMGIFLFVSILMAIEYIMQQMRIHKLKNDIGNLESEVTELKAKLYDKSQEATAIAEEISFDDVDKGDEDADEEDED